MTQVSRLSGLPNDLFYQDEIGRLNLSGLFSKENIAKAYNTAQTANTLVQQFRGTTSAPPANTYAPTPATNPVAPTGPVMQKEGTTADGTRFGLSMELRSTGYLVYVNGAPNGELMDFSISSGVLSGFNKNGTWYTWRNGGWVIIPAPTTQITVTSVPPDPGNDGPIETPSNNTMLLIGAGLLALVLLGKKKKNKE